MNSEKEKRVRPLKSHDEMVVGWLLDPDFKAEYDDLEEEYSLLKEMLQARKRAKLTQEAVAMKMGTKAPAIARLEAASDKHSPSVSTLRKYAKAVGCTLEIRLKRCSRKYLKSNAKKDLQSKTSLL